MSTVLEVNGLKKHYKIKPNFWTPVQSVKAMDGISFSLGENETLAVVGESGCGKSTLAKVLMGIEGITAGDYRLFGKDSAAIAPVDFRGYIQMIFQDPYSSINPRKKAWQIISEPLVINSDLSTEKCREKALETMKLVGLRPEFADRYPHQFSGGQRQRIGIARALILRPKIMICDEPVSALDVSIQAQVINLLIELQDKYRLSYIFISHDLNVVRHLADKVLVMYLGKVVEYGTRQQVFTDPRHPYTQALLASTPKVKGAGADLDRPKLTGELPSPLNPPSGCAFHKRCPVATDMCSQMVPDLTMAAGRQVACHLVQDHEPKV